MAKYRRIPDEVEAMQFTRQTYEDLVKFTDGIARDLETERSISGRCTCLLADDSPIPCTALTLVEEGAYVIKKPTGGFRVLSKRQFEEQYAPVEE